MFLITLGVICALALCAPASSLADQWTITPGPIAAVAGSSASLSVTNFSGGSLFLELGVFGAGDDETIASGQTYTSRATCSGSGCSQGVTIVSPSPDVIPALSYQPAGGSGTTTIPAGGFVTLDDDVGTVGDFLLRQASAAGTETTALTGVQSSLASLQTTVIAIQSMLSSVQSAVGSVQTSVTRLAGASSTASQLDTLDSKVTALTVQVSKLEALLKPKPKRKSKPKARPKSTRAS